MGWVRLRSQDPDGMERASGRPSKSPFYVPQTVSRVRSQFRCASLASRASS